MRVIKTCTQDDLMAELFGPIQEASRKHYVLDLDPRTRWCELSELRLTSLLIDYKPVGINREFNMIAIVDRMNRIYDDEPRQSEVFLDDNLKGQFNNQLTNLATGQDVTRVTFPPKYTVRPSMDMTRAKLDTWYGMACCEENESVPVEFHDLADFELPEELRMAVREREEQEKKERQNSEQPVKNGREKRQKKEKDPISNTPSSVRKRKVTTTPDE